MPQAPIHFVPQQSSGQDALGGAMPIAINVFIDKAGAIRRRPGIRHLATGPTSVIDANGLVGIHRCLNGDIYAVGAAGSERPIYRITGASSTKLGAGIAPAGLRGMGRPTFAETEALLVIAGGETMQAIVLATAASGRMPDDPPQASYVITNSLRILTNDLAIDRTKIRYSDTSIGTVDYSGNETWTLGPSTTAGFFTAEARPDPIVALAENTNAVLVFGTTTLEFWQQDATYVFTRNGTLNNGCSAPYTVTSSEQKFYWLDDLKRVLSGGENGVDVISVPIQRTLDAMDTTGAFGYRVYTGPLDCVAFTFPADGRTLVYQESIGWSQWHGWDGSALTPFTVKCLHQQTLVGTVGGHIGELSLDASTDLGADFKSYIETGFADHGTSAVKDCTRVLLTLRRGASSDSPAPVLSLKWRDRPGPWEEPIQISLGASDDTEPVVDLPSLGTYRIRQWCIEFTGHDDLTLVSAMEEYTVTEA